MKRKFIMLVLSLCLLLTACGNNAANTPNNENEQTQAPAASEEAADPVSSIIKERKAKAEKNGEYQKVVFHILSGVTYQKDCKELMT